jgi:predicted enzyme related to lactoylglutathione lyase
MPGEEKEAAMLRGLTTVNYRAEDMPAAIAWYTELLGVEPYFERPGGGAPPAYVEFRIGDYQHELGLIDARYRADEGVGSVVTYWAVDDVQAAFDRLLELGAKEHEGVTKRGDGFVTATVIDPFGNLLGIMENAHYQEILARTGPT